MKDRSRLFDILSQPRWAQGNFSLPQCPNRSRMLGLTVPPSLLARAAEVIEWRCDFAAVHESGNGPIADESQCDGMSAGGES
jgi:hypothetical protein